MSKDLLYELIESLTILPGVGKKSAQRMALFLLDKNKGIKDDCWAQVLLRAPAAPGGLKHMSQHEAPP